VSRPGPGDLPQLDGVLDAVELAATAESIAALQRPSGMIPWYPGGHCDPWNHVETAMALTVAGRRTEAERAYEWLAATQRPDGSWHNYYVEVDDRLEVEDAKLDTNVTAYVATGVWHHWLVTEDKGFVEDLWPVVQRALDFVTSMQTARGEVVWARHADHAPWDYALLTGSSSIVHSLRCGSALADLLGEERPGWRAAADRLGHVVATMPHAFEPKDRWAMDWYYPVIGGVLTGDAARARLQQHWDTFVLDGRGVRCVSDEPWVTAAETAECAIAHAAAGDRDTALALLRTTRLHRRDDGSYLTGIVYPHEVAFPEQETTAYTAAAVILAVDLVTGTSAASGVFAH
jgi:hypothetical protein